MNDDELETIRKKKIEQLRKKLAYPSDPIEVNSSNFNDILKRYETVVVDFWAEWCGPCRIMSAWIKQFAKKYRGKIVFTKVNVDENRELALRFGIMSIPTLIIFKNGKEADRIVGLQPVERIEATILKHLTE